MVQSGREGVAEFLHQLALSLLHLSLSLPLLSSGDSSLLGTFLAPQSFAVSLIHLCFLSQKLEPPSSTAGITLSLEVALLDSQDTYPVPRLPGKLWQLGAFQSTGSASRPTWPFLGSSSKLVGRT